MSHNGDRVWWPAGMEVMSPAERVAALDRGWWLDGADIVTRDGRRLTAVPFSVTPRPDLDPPLSEPTRTRVEAVAVNGPAALGQKPEPDR